MRLFMQNGLKFGLKCDGRGQKPHDQSFLSYKMLIHVTNPLSLHNCKHGFATRSGVCKRGLPFHSQAFWLASFRFRYYFHILIYFDSFCCNMLQNVVKYILSKTKSSLWQPWFIVYSCSTLLRDCPHQCMLKKHTGILRKKWCVIQQKKQLQETGRHFLCKHGHHFHIFSSFAKFADCTVNGHMRSLYSRIFARKCQQRLPNPHAELLWQPSTSQDATGVIAPFQGMQHLINEQKTAEMKHMQRFEDMPVSFWYFLIFDALDLA